MGYARPKPKRLAEKLLQIRTSLGLSQTDMWRRLGLDESVTYDRISKYETGKNEPPLLVLLDYARLAGVNMEALVDDELNLPDKLPGTVKHEQLRRAYTTRRKKH
jgi:transcriptional regulator with XRE-family HTH domain